jgi:hypothetical protein
MKRNFAGTLANLVIYGLIIGLVVALAVLGML